MEKKYTFVNTLQFSVLPLIKWKKNCYYKTIFISQIRAAHCKTNKAQTLYSTDSHVCSIVPNLAGTGFLSGHADGSIVRWYIAEDSMAKPQGI